jgi:Hypothetical protein (DUF2513)
LKRDIELIRKIILYIEDLPTASNPNGEIPIDGYSPEQIGYHCYLIVDSGLAKGFDSTDLGSASPCWTITHLTSAGHDFADASRNETVWRRVTKQIRDTVGSAALEVLKDALISAGKAAASTTLN